MTPLRLVFLGSDPIALPALEWLAGEGGALARPVAVFTQPDRPAGRGMAIRPNAIKAWALDHKLPVLQPERLGAAERAALQDLRPDLALVMAYGRILSEEFIGVPRIATVNLHASLLPKYRGASPIQCSIASGERESGVSLMRIVRRLDAGPVADSQSVEIGPLDTALDLEEKLAAACVPLLARALPSLAARHLNFTDQDDGKASYCRRLTKGDGVLDFAASGEALAARINGLFPWPGCSAEFAGTWVRVGLADLAPGAARPTGVPAGSVLGPDAEGLLVACGSGVLRLRRLQRPGGRMLGAGDFLRGFPVAPGTVLPSLEMPPLVGAEPFR